MIDGARATSPLSAFLISYALTAVLGNLVYLTPGGAALPGMSIPRWNGSFPMQLDAGFWVLVALPFIVATPISLFVGARARRPATWIGRAVPEIGRIPYSVLCIALYAYVITSLVRAGAISALLTPTTGVGAVEARFALLSHLSFPETTALKSLLVFLSVYSIIRANRDRRPFWIAAAILNFIAMICCLSLLAMKWPAVLFVLCAAVAVFISARRRYILGSAAVAAIGVGVYLVLSAFLLHLSPAPPVAVRAPTSELAAPAHRSSPQTVTPPSTPVKASRAAGKPPAYPQTAEVKTWLNTMAKDAIDLGKTAAVSVPFLAKAAVNRMAISVPYYYAYHADNPGCPQSITLLYPKRSLACEPTLLVYQDIFGKDGFQGAGTSPAAVHIYGFALAGWKGALTALAIASFVIGLFITLWPAAKTNSIYAAALAMGSYTAYNFSQLPIEGPLIYDHGMWWVLMVFGWMTIYWAAKGLGRVLRRR